MGRWWFLGVWEAGRLCYSTTAPATTPRVREIADMDRGIVPKEGDREWDRSCRDPYSANCFSPCCQDYAMIVGFVFNGLLDTTACGVLHLLAA